MVAKTEQEHQVRGMKRGQKGIVSHFTDDRVAGKLMAMGILPGSEIQLVRKAPFGGGCYIKADNLLIALRQQEANCIILR